MSMVVCIAVGMLMTSLVPLRPADRDHRQTCRLVQVRAWRWRQPPAPKRHRSPVRWARARSQNEPFRHHKSRKYNTLIWHHFKMALASSNACKDPFEDGSSWTGCSPPCRVRLCAKKRPRNIKALNEEAIESLVESSVDLSDLVQVPSGGKSVWPWKGSYNWSPSPPPLFQVLLPQDSTVFGSREVRSAFSKEQIQLVVDFKATNLKPSWTYFCGVSQKTLRRYRKRHSLIWWGVAAENRSLFRVKKQFPKAHVLTSAIDYACDHCQKLKSYTRIQWGKICDLSWASKCSFPHIYNIMWEEFCRNWKFRLCGGMEKFSYSALTYGAPSTGPYYWGPLRGSRVVRRSAV